MGLMRLGLALCVLVFHAGFGGAGGPIAVYGFYVLSGYLIYRVYLERYQPARHGLVAFYWNRFLRIVPLFLVVSLLTYLALLAVRGRFSQLPVNGVRYMQSAGFSWTDLWAGLAPQPLLHGGPRPQFVVYFGWLPQFWTVSLELAFYLAAPGFCVARRRWGPRATYALLAAFGCVYAAYAAIPAASDIALYSDVVYRNALPTMFFFTIGMTLYELHSLTRLRVPAPAALLSTLVVLALVLAGTRFVKLPLAAVPEFVVWQIVAVAGASLVILARPPTAAPLRRLDAALADLSYGVYLNQSVLLVFWFAWHAATGDTDYPSVAAWKYVVLCAATVGLSWLTFEAVEKPFNRARAGQAGERHRAQSHLLNQQRAV